MTDKINELVQCLKSITKEQAKLKKYTSIESDLDGTTIKRRSMARENARETAIELRRLAHEAHCLAVELGIADRREDKHYEDSVAPCGFGNYRKFHKRKPEEIAGQPNE